MLCVNMKELHEKSRANLLENQDLATDNEAKLDNVQSIKTAPFCFLKNEV